MAIKTFYLLNTGYGSPPPYVTMIQDGTAPAAAATTIGWNVGATSLATPFWAGQVTRKATFSQATSNIDTRTSPNQGVSGISPGDYFLTPTTVNGTFAAGNWTLNFGLRSSVDTAGTQAGRIRCRVWAGVNVNGSGARELTSGALVGSTITLSATGTTYTSSVTWNAPAIQLYDEYLMFEIEWNATAVGVTGSDVVFYQSASVIQTTDLSGVGNHILIADPQLYRMQGPPNTSTNNTGELLHMDGQQGGTTFLESCGFYPLQPFNQPRVWTSHGVTTTTADSKFGGTSAYFDGSSWIDTPATPTFSLGTANNVTPTLGFQFKVTAGDGTLRYLMGVANPSGGNNTFMVYLDANNKLKWEIKPPTGNTHIVTSINAFPVSENVFHYVSIGQLKSLADPDYYLNMWIDGVQQGSSILYASRPNIPPVAYKFSIGRLGEWNSNYFTGYIDEWWYYQSSQSEFSSSGFGRLVPIWDFPKTNLKLGRPALAAIPGSYNLSGKDAILKQTKYVMSADKGLYILFRNSADLQYGRKVNAVKGVYSYQPIDGNDQYVKILHHFDGANGSQTFTDSSLIPTGLVWSAATAQLSAVQAKFGNTSLAPSGGYAYTQATAPMISTLALGNQPWTIDCQFYVGADGVQRWLFGTSDGPANAGSRVVEVLLNNDGRMYALVWYSGGSVIQLLSTTFYGTATNPGWHHFELCRTPSNIIKMFIDGVERASDSTIGTASLNAYSNRLDIGYLGNYASGNAWNSHIDEFRYSAGVCRHSNDFAPPIAPYSATTFITGKTLIAGQGNYTLSGKDVTFKRTKYRAIQDKGTYSFTGSATGLAIGRKVNAANGVYSSTGRPTTTYHIYNILADSGLYPITGKDAAVRVPNRRLYSANGVYTRTGQNASLIFLTVGVFPFISYSYTGKTVTFYRNYATVAAKGNYAVTGKPASFVVTRIFPVSTGNYALTGNAAKAIYGLNSQRGTFSLTGKNVAFKAIRKLYAVTGTYTRTGQAVAFKATRKLYAATGTYTQTGNTVAFRAIRKLYSAFRSFTIAGNASILRLGHQLYPVVKGNYATTGNAITLRLGHRLNVTTGTYAINGQGLTLQAKRKIYLDYRAYIQTGIPNISLHKYVVIATRGSYAITGKVIHQIGATFKSYAITGKAISLQAKRTIYLAKGNHTQIGYVANLKCSHRILANSGGYALSGTAILRASHKLYADKGNYNLSGQSLTLRVAHKLYGNQRNFTIAGNVAGLTEQHRVIASYRAFVINGKSISLRETHYHYLNQGTFSLTGRVITLRKASYVRGIGTYNLIGKPVSFPRIYKLWAYQGTYRFDRPDTLLVKRSAFPGGYGIVGTPVTFIRSYKRISSANMLSGKPVSAAKKRPGPQIDAQFLEWEQH